MQPRRREGTSCLRAFVVAIFEEDERLILPAVLEVHWRARLGHVNPPPRIVALRKVLTEMSAAALLAPERRARDQIRHRQQVELPPPTGIERRRGGDPTSGVVGAFELHDRLG